MRFNFLWGSILALTITSCFEKEIFSDTPHIAFEKIAFYVNDNGPDSLILVFSFEDGTGDIGLSSFQDLQSPYHIYDVIIDSENNLIPIRQDTSDIKFPLFKAPISIIEENGEAEYYFFPEQKSHFSDYDNRPKMYGCDFYEIIAQDTLYIARNEFYYNFYIDFEVKVGENYIPVNFMEIFNTSNCLLGNFNGRIPYFPEGRNGIITYSMFSQGFHLAFLDKTMRANFFIYDRAKNKSNIVYTPDFVLAEITQ